MSVTNVSTMAVRQWVKRNLFHGNVAHSYGPRPAAVETEPTQQLPDMPQVSAQEPTANVTISAPRLDAAMKLAATAHLSTLFPPPPVSSQGAQCVPFSQRQTQPMSPLHQQQGEDEDEATGEEVSFTQQQTQELTPSQLESQPTPSGNQTPEHLDRENITGITVSPLPPLPLDERCAKKLPPGSKSTPAANTGIPANPYPFGKRVRRVHLILCMYLHKSHVHFMLLSVFE